MEPDPEHWWTQLRPLVDGRRAIVKHEVVAGSVSMVQDLRRLGASEVLVVATNGTGAGPLPSPDEAQWCTFRDGGEDGQGVGAASGASELDMVAGIHAGNRATRHPPQHIVERIERFDPGRDALVVGDFLNEAPDLCGRPFLAHRRPEWLALDDKTVVDAFWDRCGIPRVASTVVEASVEAARAAFDLLDRGDGVVVNADATEGWTGGGSGVRWARTVDDVDAALSGWTGPQRRIRLMPFLEGIPCSVHGIVLDDAVIALRPVEMVTLRDPMGGFFYAGCATFWDPPTADREEMRTVARTVGATLRAEVAHRGPFTIDGVMTRAGFRPTELNPRNGAGLARSGRASRLPLQLLFDAMVGGIDVDWRARELERLLLDRFDAERWGGTWRAVAARCTPVDDQQLTMDGVEVTWGVGPSPMGSFLRSSFDAATFPAGSPAAPLAAKVWSEWNTRFDLGLPPLTAAPDVRTS